MKSARDTGTRPWAELIVTVHVQVVFSFCTGKPSPGTTGPVTVIRTEPPVNCTRTPSPLDVNAGRSGVPVSTLSALISEVGRNDGVVPYLSSDDDPHAGQAGTSANETTAAATATAAVRGSEPARQASPAGACVCRSMRSVRVVEHVRAERRQAGLGGEAEVALAVQAAGDRAGR